MSGRTILLAVAMILCLMGSTNALADQTDQHIRDAIAHLGDPNPAQRDKATRYLWTSGGISEPLLHEAAQSTNPEIASRARAILRNLQTGILPDTSPAVVEMANLYRIGSRDQRGAAANRMIRSGPDGLRVVLALFKREKDPASRQLLLQAMSPRSHEAAMYLIGNGDLAGTDTLLRAACVLDTMPARDNAAFALMQGTIDRQIAERKSALQVAHPDWDSAPPLIYLARANGDFATARWAAQGMSDPGLLHQVLIEQKDWKTLSGQFRSRPGDSQSLETLAFAASFARLSRNHEDLSRAIDAIEAYAVIHPDEFWKCAEAMFLNDRPDEAIDLLLTHKDYARATEFLMPRMEYQRVVDLSLRARVENNPERWQLRLREAAALRFMGKRDSARAIIAELTADPRSLVAEQWAMICEADRQIGDKANAQRHQLTGLSIATPELAAALLESPRFPEDFPALSWWIFLRRHASTETAKESWQTMQDLAQGRLPLDKLKSYADAALADLGKMRLRPGQRDEELGPAAEALFVAKQYSQAMYYFGKLQETFPTPRTLQRIGDCQAMEGNWADAAATYLRCWEMDKSHLVPLVLVSFALHKAGNDLEASKTMKLVHLLPLSDDGTRLELADALNQNGFADDAKVEMDLLLKTAPFLSRSAGRILARRADEAERKKDYLAAADLLQQAFIGNLQTDVNFLRPWANLAIPSLIHRCTALGLARKGQAAQAAEEAQICLKETPGDADGLIDIVNAMEQHGSHAQAQSIFNASLTRYRRLATDYPQSGPSCNLIAWFEVRCGMNLDDALRSAQRATELEPRNTASLDTLAEVLFARGDPASAAKIMQRCIDLEPEEVSHGEQLKRFQSAQTRPAGASAPN